MNPGLRRLHRVVVCLLVAGAAVSMRASADWASAGALGDVAIAFDNQVQLFANADGALKETIDIDELTGTNTGLAFDTSLDLLVTNTDAQGTGASSRSPRPIRTGLSARQSRHRPRLDRLPLPLTAQSMWQVPAARFADTTRQERCLGRSPSPQTRRRASASTSAPIRARCTWCPVAETSER